MWHEYHHEAVALLGACTAVFVFCRVWLERSHRRYHGAGVARSTSKHQPMVKVQVCTKFAGIDASTDTNAVYLTRFHTDAFRALALHVAYGCVAYFRDVTNIYYLCVSAMLIFEYRDTRALTNALVLVAFDLLATANHVWGVSGLLRRQHTINNQPTMRLVRRRVFGDGGVRGATEALVEEVVSTSQLRRGDVIRVVCGRDVPCDVLLLGQGEGVQVHELQLAGEDVVVSKSCLTGDVLRDAIEVRVQPQADQGVVHVTAKGGTDVSTAVYNASHLVFRGTQVVDREALGVVIETGNDCAIYRITHDQHKPPTQIQKQTMHVCINNLYLMLLLASSMSLVLHKHSDQARGLVFVWPLLRKMLLLFNTLVPLSHQFFFSEGSRLLSRGVEHAFPKGAVVVNRNGVMAFQHHDPHWIVTDKTGTVTLNRLELTSWWRRMGPRESEWKQVLHQSAGVEADDACLLAQVLACSDIQPHSTSGELLKSDPVEEALVRATLKHANAKLRVNETRGAIVVMSINGSVSQLEETRWTRIASVPFDFATGGKLAVLRDRDGRVTLHMQGTPEAVRAYAASTEVGHLDSLLRKIEDAPASSDSYRRMIAYGACTLDRSEVALLEGGDDTGVQLQKVLLQRRLTDLSLYVFLDRIVPGVADSIARLTTAQGRGVVLLTGDKASSACEIGRVLGLVDASFDRHQAIGTDAQLEAAVTDEKKLLHAGILLDGGLLQERVSSGRTEVLRALFAAADRSRLRSVVVFRASPAAKQMLVRLLQSWNPEQSVVMMGDGCNDMAALVQADISFAISHGDENRNVQDMADVVLDDWNRLVPLMTSFAEKRERILRVSAWVMQKHFATAATLLTLLVLSDFQQLRDPSHPLAMNLFNAVAFVAMCIYCNGQSHAHAPSADETRCRSICDRFTRHMVYGAAYGAVLTAAAFTLAFDVQTQVECGIHCLVALQGYLLVRQLLAPSVSVPVQQLHVE